MERNIKALKASYQERRRVAALEKQRNARKQVTDKARKLALGGSEGEDSQETPQCQQQQQQQQDDEVLEDTSSSTPSQEVHMRGGGGRRASGGGRGAGGARLRQHYAAQLMQPEWLVDVPPDLGTDWYALPRPEGQRCLVIAARGVTTARLRNGTLFERFPSLLPGGGPGQRASEDSFSILDCVFHEADQTYCILDLMCWRGYSLYGCTAEFRLFWVQSKLAESGATAAHPVAAAPAQHSPNGGGSTGPSAAGGQQQGAQQQGGTRRFLPLAAYRCTPEGLHSAHSHPVSFTRDGLLLLHKEGQYSPGQTPLALLWKDAASSRYFIDTDAAGVPLPQQQVVLEYRMDRTVATHDDTPAVLGRMPDSFVQQMGDRLRPGKLLRFGIGPGGIAFQDGQPVGADLHFAGPANQRRGRADSISKTVFQHLARTRPITLQQLQAAAAAGAAAAAVAAPAEQMGSGDSGSLLAGGGGSMSVASEPAGSSMMALEAGETDGIEVDS